MQDPSPAPWSALPSTRTLGLALGLIFVLIAACGGRRSGGRRADAAIPADASTASDAIVGGDATPAGDATVGAPIGAACVADTECSGIDSICLSDWPGGYCSQGCLTSECPTDTACLSVSSGGMSRSLCVQSCTTDDQCRIAEAYSCQILAFGQGYCAR
ncbi:MAG: hypothetical protein OEY14_06685 [Myxococcales bacterium]|nr:hypothetical protein [Myxococcales bacterium]